MPLCLGSRAIRHRSVPIGSGSAGLRNTIAACRGVNPVTHGRDHLIPLPDGGGFLLPCTNDLFGPGYAFRMTSSSTFSDNPSFGLVPYQAPPPPIVSDKGRSEARVIVYQGGYCPADFEQWEGGWNVPAGLLPQPEIAGVLPGPTEDAVKEQV